MCVCCACFCVCAGSYVNSVYVCGVYRVWVLIIYLKAGLLNKLDAVKAVFMISPCLQTVQIVLCSDSSHTVCNVSSAFPQSLHTVMATLGPHTAVQKWIFYTTILELQPGKWVILQRTQTSVLQIWYIYLKLNLEFNCVVVKDIHWIAIDIAMLKYACKWQNVMNYKVGMSCVKSLHIFLFLYTWVLLTN